MQKKLTQKISMEMYRREDLLLNQHNIYSTFLKFFVNLKDDSIVHFCIQFKKHLYFGMVFMAISRRFALYVIKTRYTAPAYLCISLRQNLWCSLNNIFKKNDTVLWKWVNPGCSKGAVTHQSINKQDIFQQP